MTEQISEESMSNAERRRFYLLSVAVILVAALVTGGLLWLTSRVGDDNIKSAIPLTAADQAEGTKISNEFLKQAGTWGLRENTINPDNMQVAHFTVQRNTRTANNYWYSRNENYPTLKEKYIAPEGDLWYSDSMVQNWWDSISREGMASFETLSVTPKVPDKGSKLLIKETEYESMIVPVKYSVRERKYYPTGTDSSWDGTYSIMKRVYEEDAQLILIKTGSGWKVYQLTGNKYPFLLSTWATPDEDYNDQQFGFEEEGRMKAKLGTGATP